MNFSLNSKSGRVGYNLSQNNVSIHIVNIVVCLEWNEKTIIIKKATVWSELNCWPPDQSCYASGRGICLTLRPRAQEDRALTCTRGPGPGAWGLPHADQFHRKPLTRCSLLFSPLRYTLLRQQTRHLPQTSPRSVLSLLSWYIFSPDCFSLYVSSRFSTTKLAKQRFPKVMFLGS